ncbi:MAG: hypothetical protein ACREBJ_13190 [Nitrosotalea sp.]
MGSIIINDTTFETDKELSYFERSFFKHYLGILRWDILISHKKLEEKLIPKGGYKLIYLGQNNYGEPIIKIIKV